MEVRTIKMVWEDLDSLFETFFKEVLGKTIECHVDFDDQTYWGVRFVDYEKSFSKCNQDDGSIFWQRYSNRNRG